MLARRTKLTAGRFEGGEQPIALDRRSVGGGVGWALVGGGQRGLGSDADAGRRRDQAAALRELEGATQELRAVAIYLEDLTRRITSVR